MIVKPGKISVTIGALTILLLGFLIAWNSRMTGVSKSRIQRDAREIQEISGDWKTVQAGDENIYVVLFYDKERSDCRYCVYLSYDDVVYGYLYNDGGSDNYIESAARCMIYEDRGIALLSLNRDRVCGIEAGNGADRKIIEIDPEKPFAVVLPVGSGEITLYDAQGKIVPFYDTFKGAVRVVEGNIFLN